MARRERCLPLTVKLCLSIAAVAVAVAVAIAAVTLVYTLTPAAVYTVDAVNAVNAVPEFGRRGILARDRDLNARCAGGVVVVGVGRHDGSI